MLLFSFSTCMTFRILRKRLPADPPNFPANTHSFNLPLIQQPIHKILPYTKGFHSLFSSHDICIFFKHLEHLLIISRYSLPCLLIRCFRNYNHILFLCR